MPQKTTPPKHPPTPTPSQKPTYKTLRTAIQSSDIQKLKQIHSLKPELITNPKPNENALKLACLSGKTAVVTLLLQLTLKDYDAKTDKFINDSVVQCIRFERFDMVRVFVEAGFELDQVVFSKKGVDFTCIDFAILGGHYEIAYYIFNRISPKLRNLRNIKEYEILGKKYLYRYVNYQMVVNGLINNIEPDEIGNYLKKQLTKERKQEIRRIHHEGCWQWLMRVLGFAKAQVKKGNQTNANIEKVQQNPDNPENPEKIQTSRPMAKN